ncbi:MAG: hypothetical protein IKI63_01365, partial [Clostridia bacterium]|nr:hypothetical protein [Clostridia bacterium]
ALRGAPAARVPAATVPAASAPSTPTPAAHVPADKPAPTVNETPAAATATASTPAPAPSASVPAPAPAEAETPFTGWSEVLQTLSESCPPLYGVLMGSTATIRGEHVLIATANEMFKSLVTRDGNHRVLTDAIRNVTGRDYRIGLKKIAAPPAADGANEEASDSPLAAFLKESRENGLEVTVKEN